ncbi:MAG TPA: TlpA disulfide reductase family protein [Gemmataceae bacterium]|nr:TlpA disulfide reductase family protein [Gemmataceae bacterium]
MPSRLGRSGLRPGKKAPDFTLPSVAGEPITLHQFTGRKVLLVFTQTGCSPCQKIVPELNRLQTNDDLQVLMVNNGQTEATRQWANDVRAKFPVLVQNHFSLSKRFEIFATPFAFLIDEKGIIASKGVVNNLEHVGYVLSARRDAANNAPIETERSEEERPVSGNSLSPLTTEEVRHD